MFKVNNTLYSGLFVCLLVTLSCTHLYAIDVSSFRYSLIDQERLTASQNTSVGFGISRIEFEIYQESVLAQSVGAAETENQINILVPDLESYAETLASASDVFNFPNPFRLDEGTTFGYTLSKDMDIQIRIYNMFGQTVYINNYDAGTNGGTGTPYYNKVEFNRSHISGSSLPASIYFYILVNDGDVIGKGKMAIIP